MKNKRMLVVFLLFVLLQFTYAYQDSLGVSDYNPLFAIEPLKGKDECPPCFNCMLPGFECLHFANCSEYDGQCNCPPGFGGNDCKQPCK